MLVEREDLGDVIFELVSRGMGFKAQANGDGRWHIELDGSF